MKPIKHWRKAPAIQWPGHSRGIWTAGLSTSNWAYRIQFHGDTAADAETLRDTFFDAFMKAQQ